MSSGERFYQQLGDAHQRINGVALLGKRLSGEIFPQKKRGTPLLRLTSASKASLRLGSKHVGSTMVM